MKAIQLYGGGLATVDDEDFARLGGLRWQRNNWGYAIRTMWVKGEGRSTSVALHRVVLGAQKGVLVDHIDGDKMNCTRGNLRLCTRAENQRNKAKHGQHAFKGVREIAGGLWLARICVDYDERYLGTFATEMDAARAYDAAAVELHGAFARLNFTASAAKSA